MKCFFQVLLKYNAIPIKNSLKRRSCTRRIGLPHHHLLFVTSFRFNETLIFRCFFVHLNCQRRLLRYQYLEVDRNDLRSSTLATEYQRFVRLKRILKFLLQTEPSDCNSIVSGLNNSLKRNDFYMEIRYVNFYNRMSTLLRDNRVS